LVAFNVAVILCWITEVDNNVFSSLDNQNLCQITKWITGFFLIRNDNFFISADSNFYILYFQYGIFYKPAVAILLLALMVMQTYTVIMHSWHQDYW